MVAHGPLARLDNSRDVHGPSPAEPPRPTGPVSVAEHKENLEYKKYSDVMVSGIIGSSKFTTLHPTVGIKWIFKSTLDISGTFRQL